MIKLKLGGLHYSYIHLMEKIMEKQTFLYWETSNRVQNA